MFNQDVRNYIIDNICNVDFLDIEFLDELRKVLVSYNKETNRYLKRIFVDNDKKNVSFQIGKDIYLYEKTINSLINEVLKKYPSASNNIFTRNIIKLFIILHEVDHIFQKRLLLSKNYKDLIVLSYEARKGLVKSYYPSIYNIFPTSIKGNLLYKRNHDYFPTERIANFESINFILSLYDELDIYFKYYFSNFSDFVYEILFKDYVLFDNKIYSPIEIFYLSIGKEFNKEKFNNMSEEERVLIGIENDSDIINKVTKNKINKKLTLKVHR